MPDELKTTVIEGVELAATGWWEFSSGPRYLTQEHLQAAVDAQEDPAFETARIKIGHTDPRFDGQPLFGSITNLRLSENGQKLLGNYVIAASLAPLVAKGPDDEGEPPFPDRSIEGWFDVKTPTGKEYPFVLTAVALLGQEQPAIKGLDDIVGIFTEEGNFVAAASSGKAEDGRKLLHAGAVVDRIRMDIWKEIPADDMPWGDWSWVRRVEIDSGSKGFVIVEDEDTARLFQVPWEISGEDVKYGEPVEVVENYVAASSAKENAMRFPRQSAKTRNDAATLSAVRGAPAQAPDTLVRGGRVELAKLREKLGLGEDADEAAIEAKLDELKQSAEKQTTTETETTTTQKPDGSTETETEVETVTTPEQLAAAAKKLGIAIMDADAAEELKAQAKAGAEARERQRIDDRDRFLAAAVKAGKIPPARREHYAGLYDKDEEGTRKFIDSLAAGAIPVSETGHAGDPEAEAPESDARYDRYLALVGEKN